MDPPLPLAPVRFLLHFPHHRQEHFNHYFALILLQFSDLQFILFTLLRRFPIHTRLFLISVAREYTPLVPPGKLSRCLRYGRWYAAEGRMFVGYRFLISEQKQQQQQAENAANTGPKKKKVTAAQLRVQKGKFFIHELRLQQHSFGDLPLHSTSTNTS